MSASLFRAFRFESCTSLIVRVCYPVRPRYAKIWGVHSLSARRVFSVPVTVKVNHLHKPSPQYKPEAALSASLRARETLIVPLIVCVSPQYKPATLTNGRTVQVTLCAPRLGIGLEG